MMRTVDDVLACANGVSREFPKEWISPFESLPASPLRSYKKFSDSAPPPFISLPSPPVLLLKHNVLLSAYIVSSSP